jgi:hypothetical protein
MEKPAEEMKSTHPILRFSLIAILSTICCVYPKAAIADYQIAAKLFQAQGDRDNYQKVIKLLQEIQGNST